ncbi:MAG: exopolysaccharide biosynthesis polyprenyl glycosylphosphotransferase [Solirubrobacterales bacterium]|nr:exopolysaccharide biosynthesis polyprenyl glycosylphosphotransferase [Solirubrobacterales bacterium]
MESALAGERSRRSASDVLGPASPSDLVTRSRWPVLRRYMAFGDSVAVLIGACVGAAVAGLGIAEAGICAGVLVAAWATAGWLFGIYAGDDLRAWATGVPTTPRLLITALTVIWPYYALLKGLGETSADLAAFSALVVGTPLVITGRTMARGIVHRRSGLRQSVLIVGSGVIASQLVTKLRSQTQYGLDPVGFVDDDPHLLGQESIPHLGRLADLPSALRHHSIDRVIFAFSRAGHDELLRSIRASRDAKVAVDIVPRLFEFLDGVQGLVNVGGLPLLSMTVPRLSRRSQGAKRALDAAAATGVLLLLAPLLLTIALLIKLESHGPVLFKQRRVGRNGERFEVFKFRSMYQDAEERKAEFAALNDIGDGVMFKIHEDPRVTGLAQILRRYSIDELPQLLNVLRGEMSLVGPRPLIEREAEALAEDWHARRLDLRPGLTGPWQVSGRSDTTVEEMVRFDYTYVAGWSLARDVEILFATVPAVLAGRGAY